MSGLLDLSTEIAHIHDEVESLAEDAELLCEELERINLPWFELRELLEQEFPVDLHKPGAGLRLNTVVDDIIRLLVEPYRDDVQALAIQLRGLILGDDEGWERRSDCVDCGVDTIEIDEFYMLRRDVWAETGMEPEAGMLCIGCVEERLGRRLGPDDFPPLLMNQERLSERLSSRVLGREEVPVA